MKSFAECLEEAGVHNEQSFASQTPMGLQLRAEGLTDKDNQDFVTYLMAASRQLGPTTMDNLLSGSDVVEAQTMALADVAYAYFMFGLKMGRSDRNLPVDAVEACRQVVTAWADGATPDLEAAVRECGAVVEAAEDKSGAVSDAQESS